MSEKKSKRRNETPLKIFGIILPSLPMLMLRMGGPYLRFKRAAKKGAKIFEKELIKQGIDKNAASELSQHYLAGSDLIGSITSFR